MITGIIIGAIITIIVAVLGIFFLATILEMLKIVVLVILIPLGFLWLWAFIKKQFKLDKYIAAGLSILIIGVVAIWIYQSWWAIIGFGIIMMFAYLVYSLVLKKEFRMGLKDIIKIIGEKR